MSLPPAFKNFARNCVDISGDDSQREILDLAIHNVTADDLRGTSDFISKLLGGSYSREDLNKIWHSTGARIWYVNGYPEFLQLAKSMIDTELRQLERGR